MKRYLLSSLAMSARTTTENQFQNIKKMPVLSGIVFDMDGTLTKPNLDFGVMYQRCGVDRSKDILEEIQKMPADQRLAAEGVIEEMEEEGRRTLELMPGATELIGWLSAHQIPMAIVTRNTLRSVNVLTERLLPLDCKFQKIIARDNSEGFPPKPDPKSLEAIAQEWQISLPSESIVMVGDSLENDIVFGKNAGVSTALLDCNGNAKLANNDDDDKNDESSAVAPDVVVNHLATLPGHLWSRFSIESYLGKFSKDLHGVPAPMPTTQLGKACAEGNTDVLDKLLDNNNNNNNNNNADDECSSNVCETDDSGNTALIWAAERGHLDIVLRLLTVPEMVDAINHRGFLGANAVTRAARRGHIDILKALIDAGGELDVPNNKLQYPLHFAAFKQHPAVVELLLERGANPWVVDRKGRTPSEDTACPNIRDTLRQAMSTTK